LEEETISGVCYRRKNMKCFARALAVTLGLVVLGVFVLLVSQKNATGAGAAPVTVVNTPLPVGVTNTAANPVPVSGLVAVGNERTLTGGGFVPVPLDVTVTNGTLPVTGYVSISGRPTVQDALDSPAAPFQQGFCGSIQVSGCPGPNGIHTTFFVPRDSRGNPQRLVIEYASGSCTVIPGGGGTVGLLTTAGGIGVIHSFALVNTASTQLTFGQRTKIYADPDSEVAFIVQGPFACTGAISGYLISPTL
jgi:hypothetical protein